MTTNRFPTQQVVTNTRGFSNSSFGNRGISNVNFGFNNRINVKDRLYRIDCEIDELLDERAYLRKKSRKSRGYSRSVERRLDRIDYRLDELKRERKYIVKNYSHRNAYH